MSPNPKPLLSRPLDTLYTIFFAVHIPTFFLMDSQALYARHFAGPLRGLLEWYLDVFNDPIMGGALGEWSTNERKLGGITVGGGNDWVWVWIRSFLLLEALFQLPIFVLGIINLRKDNKKFYPYLLMYGASTTTTLLPSLAIVLCAPIGEKSIRGVQITEGQRLNLLLSYIPFLVIPLMMAVDMSLRIVKIIGESEGRKGKKVAGKSYADAVKKE